MHGQPFIKPKCIKINYMIGFCVILHHTIIGGCNASAGHVMVARGCTEGRPNIHVCRKRINESVNNCARDHEIPVAVYG